MNMQTVIGQVGTEALPAINKILEDAGRQITELCGFEVRVLANIPPQELNLSVVQENVCNAFGVNWIQIAGKKRDKFITNARFVYIWFCRRLLNMTLAQIAATVNRDHTSVIHAVKAVDDWMETGDVEIAPKILRLQTKFVKIRQAEYRESIIP